jgi:hypothetical protein
MAWNDNDPWANHAARNQSGGNYRAPRAPLKPTDTASLLEPKAAQAATLLMNINAREATSRQVAAANTSALFHLLISAGERNLHGKHSEDRMEKAELAQPPSLVTATNVVKQNFIAPTVETAQILQDMLGRHAGKPLKSLANAMAVYRGILPQEYIKKLDIVNKAASYVRHHGATVDIVTINVIVVALDSLPPVEAAKDDAKLDEEHIEADLFVANMMERAPDKNTEIEKERALDKNTEIEKERAPDKNTKIEKQRAPDKNTVIEKEKAEAQVEEEKTSSLFDKSKGQENKVNDECVMGALPLEQAGTQVATPSSTSATMVDLALATLAAYERRRDAYVPLFPVTCTAAGAAAGVSDAEGSLQS